VRLLLDTCVLLWWWAEAEKLSPRALSLIRQRDSEIWVSAASAWEIATKYRIGKFPAGGRIVEEWEDQLEKDRFKELPISHR
jgi:PIN domain nuclease of toxin-antitoxin system